MTVAGYLFHDDAAAQQALLDAALNNFPLLGQQLRATIQSLPGSGVALLFGSILLLWASLGFTKVAQTAMAEIWSVPRRLRPGFWQNLGRSVWALAGLALPTLLTAATTIIGVEGPRPDAVDARHAVLVRLHREHHRRCHGHAARPRPSTSAPTCFTFRALTPHSVTTNKLVPGTVLFTLFWAALTAFGSVILTGRVARANQLYGTIGFIIGLIFWIYLGAYGALLSSELNAVRAMRLYPRTLFGPPSTAIDERALLSRARTEELVPGQVVEVRYSAAAARRRTVAPPGADDAATRRPTA